MIFLSFNCRALDSPLKKLALKRLIFSYHLDIIFLKETLGEGDKVTRALEPLLPKWIFVASDAKGRYKGLIICFN